jgi:hypothetical protein
MTAKTPRPFFVTLSLVVLWLELILNLSGMYAFSSRALDRDWVSLIFFVIIFAMATLIVVTIVNIQFGRPAGRWLCIVTFGIGFIFSFYSIWNLMHPTHAVDSPFIFAVIIVGLRMIISPVILLAFIFSTHVKEYFTPDAGPFLPPPPPSSFED